MDNINRQLISKVFSYATNDYNHRFGFDDENQKNTRQLITAIDNQKTFLFKQGIRTGTRVWIDSNNVCFCYLATVIALCELGTIFDLNAELIIGNQIDLEELYSFKSRDSVFTHQMRQRRVRKDTLLYDKKTHYTVINTAREWLPIYKGHVLIVTHPSIQKHIDTILLPLLISNNVKQISAIGVNNIEQAKSKIEHLCQHIGATQIISYNDYLPYLKISDETKIFNYT